MIYTMANLNVAVLAPPGYAKKLGKPGTTTDLIFYNLKQGEDTVTLIEPVRHPERLAPLFYAVSMATEALVVIDGITPAFGEWVVMLQCAGVTEGCIILRNYITPDQIAPFITGTLLETYDIVEDDAITLRERLLSRAAGMEADLPAVSGQSVGTVCVDHHFPVKGIGTVVLGCVVEGVIRRHDTLRLLPGERTVQLRSIQKHDDDADAAVAGDRVGLALKQISADDLDRGFVLTTNDKIKYATSIEGHADLVAWWKSPLREGMVLHIGHWMQFIPARVEAVTEPGDWRKPVIRLALEKEIIYLPGDTAVLTCLDTGGLRIAGTIKLP